MPHNHSVRAGKETNCRCISQSCLMRSFLVLFNQSVHIVMKLIYLWFLFILNRVFIGVVI